MAKLIDLVGKKFGRWTVLSFVGRKQSYHELVWRCQCECGNTANVNGSTLKKGCSTSCGCYSAERARTHGMEGTPTYNAWAHMLTRCNNVRHKQYGSYGGRGIKVCPEWHSFEAFFADMGKKPKGKSIDRIDNDGGYNKENCRWAKPSQQNRNRRGSPKYEWNGEIRSLADIADEVGVVKWRKAYERVRNGWSVRDAVTVKRANRWHRTDYEPAK